MRYPPFFDKQAVDLFAAFFNHAVQSHAGQHRRNKYSCFRWVGHARDAEAWAKQQSNDKSMIADQYNPLMIQFLIRSKDKKSENIWHYDLSLK